MSNSDRVINSLCGLGILVLLGSIIGECTFKELNVYYNATQIKTQDLDGNGVERYIDINNERFYSIKDGKTLGTLLEQNAQLQAHIQP